MRERQSRRSALTPEYDEKNGIAAAAQSLFNQRKAESDRCYAVYSEFEKALRKAETDSNAANTAAAGCRAALENAETAHRNAVETEMRLHKQLEELRNDSAQTEVLAAKTDRESEKFRKAESEKASIVAELNAESVRLAGEKRALEKQIADAERSLTKLGRDLQKTKSDRTALTQQLDALKTAANGKKGADKDAAMQKVNAAKTKADAAAETEKQQTSEHSALASECAALREKLTECERCVAENDEKLRSARHEYDTAKAQTAAMNEESTGRKAALAGKNATLDALAAQLENAKLRIAETEKPKPPPVLPPQPPRLKPQGSKPHLTQRMSAPPKRKRSMPTQRRLPMLPKPTTIQSVPILMRRMLSFAMRTRTFRLQRMHTITLLKSSEMPKTALKRRVQSLKMQSKTANLPIRKRCACATRCMLSKHAMKRQEFIIWKAARASR